MRAVAVLLAIVPLFVGQATLQGVAHACDDCSVLVIKGVHDASRP